MSECPSAGGEGAQVLVPVPSDKDDIDPKNMMPPANQQPSPGQPFPLPTERQASFIQRIFMLHNNLCNLAKTYYLLFIYFIWQKLATFLFLGDCTSFCNCLFSSLI